MLTTAEYATVLDAVPEAVFTIDREFNITSFNSAAERITGYRRDEVVGQRCRHILRSNVCGDHELCPMCVMFRTGRTCDGCEMIIHHRDEYTTTVRVSVRPIFANGGDMVGGVKVFRPVLSELVPAGARRDNLSLLNAMERQTIEETLRRHRWNRSTACEELGVSRTTLWRKMRKLRIPMRLPADA